MSDDGQTKPETESAKLSGAHSKLAETFASFDAEQKAAAAGAGVSIHDAPTDDEVSTEAAGDAEPDARDQRIAELETEVAALNDQLLRSAADLQNARKRAERDRKDAETFGGVKLARDVLAVYDNLETALNHASAELQEKEPGFFNGVELTLKELLNAFGKHRITLIKPEPGERFDPNKHQAMYEAPTDAVEAGCVVDTMQAGFMIADRLLRPAMVGVAKAPAASEAAQG